MEIIGFVVFVLIIGVFLDMIRGRKPEFKLYHSQQLKPWNPPPAPPPAISHKPSYHDIGKIDGEILADECLQHKPLNPGVSDRPRLFRVDGIDKESGMDTTWYCQALSAANAKVKAELQGIIVTNVQLDT